jgi:hypothetical protein
MTGVGAGFTRDLCPAAPRNSKPAPPNATDATELLKKYQVSLLRHLTNLTVLHRYQTMPAAHVLASAILLPALALLGGVAASSEIQLR